MDLSLPVMEQPAAAARLVVELPDDPAAHGPAALAQLIEYARGRFAALPVHAAIELIDGPTVLEVPGAAYYCDRLIAWRGQHLPLLNLETLLAAHGRVYAAPLRYALIVAYQPRPRAPLAYGALALPATPRVVHVHDAAACPLPVDSDLWTLVALSCFREGTHTVPVLDTTSLFARFHG